MAAPTFYNAKDQAIYDAGDKFVPKTEYLQNDYVPTSGISYEGDGSPVSYANSMGIITQAPIIYPPINQSGGDGGDGSDNGPKDYGYKGGTLEDIGEGTIDDEDEKKGSLGIVDALRAIGAFTVGGPINAGYSLKKSFDRNNQKEIDQINAGIENDYGPNDRGLRGNDSTPGFGITAAGNYVNQFEGGDPGLSMGGFDTGGGKEMMAKGGRVGYFFGGRVNYKAGGRVSFKNGGLASIL